MKALVTDAEYSSLQQAEEEFDYRSLRPFSRFMHYMRAVNFDAAADDVERQPLLARRARIAE